MDVVAAITRNGRALVATMRELGDLSCRVDTVDQLPSAIAALTETCTGTPAAQVRVRLDLRGCFVTTKFVRQALMHAAVLDQIDREHQDIDTHQVRGRLTRLRSRESGRFSLACLDRWEHLIALGDTTLIRQVVLADTGVGEQMRSCSPILGLLHETERLRVLTTISATPQPGIGHPAETE